MKKHILINKAQAKHKSCLLLILVLLSLPACKSQQKITQNQTATTLPSETPIQNASTNNTPELRQVKVQTATDGQSINISLAEDNKALPRIPYSSQEKYYIGTLNLQQGLGVGSALQLTNRNLSMTSISMMEAQSPRPLLIKAEHFNKLAIVKGFLSGNTLYSAKLMLVFQQNPTEMLFKLLNDQTITIDQLEIY